MSIFIALGSNIEPRHQHLIEALKLLEGHDKITIIKRSSIYETAPVGYTDQADFLNMVVEVKTSLSAIALLDICQSVEQQLGREREIRFGPRTIDLDILLFHNENRKTERLIIPHPRMHERAFVLTPLAEIVPDYRIPTLNNSVSDLLKKLTPADKKDVKLWTANDLENE